MCACTCVQFVHVCACVCVHALFAVLSVDTTAAQFSSGGYVSDESCGSKLCSVLDLHTNS